MCGVRRHVAAFEGQTCLRTPNLSAAVSRGARCVRGVKIFYARQPPVRRAKSTGTEVMLMNYVVIRHQVANFQDWKEVYDQHAPARAAAGLKEEHVLTNVDHKN